MNRPRTRRMALVATLTTTAFTFACTTTSYQVAGYSMRYRNEVYPPTERVAVFQRGKPPARPYAVIGAIEIAGGPETQNHELLDAAVERAKALGAEALVEVTYVVDEPEHVTKNRFTKTDPAKTAAAVIAGVLIIGVLVAVMAASSASDSTSHSDNASHSGRANRRHGHDDSSAGDEDDSPSASEHRVPILRAQAVRFVAEPAATVAAAATPSFTEVHAWLSREVLKHRGALLSCARAISSPPEAVQVATRFQVAADGRLLDAEVQASSAGSAAFEQCLVTAFRSWRFSAPPGGGRLDVSLPLQIETTGLDASAPATPAPSRLWARSLFFMGLRPSLPSDAAAAEVATALLARELGRSELLDVKTLADVEASYRLELQKDTVGCDDVTCASSIGGALGAELVCYGQVTTLRDQRSLAASLIDRDGNVVARSVVLAPLAGSLEPSVETLVRELLQQLPVRVLGAPAAAPRALP